jgi:hypothetical protein
MRGRGRYLYAGDYDKAINWFNRTYQDRDPALPYLRMRLHDPLRSDPRFRDLLRRMNLPTTSAGFDPEEQRRRSQGYVVETRREVRTNPPSALAFARN